MANSTVPDSMRTRSLAEQWKTWVLPHWLERQCDPSQAAFVALGPNGDAANLTNRNRMAVGNLDGGALATVDPRGLVTFDDGSWSLDWWIGGDDRWHIPSREPAVRQTLVDDAPVVETTMRVPGGSVVQRVWAFHDPEAGEVVAIEFDNEGTLPVALALTVRPYGPDGAGRVGAATVTPDRIEINGSVAVWLTKPAHRVAVSTWAEGDVAEAVFAGAAVNEQEAETACPEGFATATVIYPLTHKTQLRFFVPMVGTHAPSLDAVPPADAVARGWAAHRASGIRVELPDPDLDAALAAAQGQLLLAASGRQLAGSVSAADTAAVVGALDRLGLHDAARPVVATLPQGQGPGGRLGGDDPHPTATSAAVVAAARHWIMARNDSLVTELAAPIAAGAHYQPRSFPFTRRTAPPTLLELGWRLRAALDASPALIGGQQPEAAEAVVALANGIRADLDQALAAVGRPSGVSVELLELVALSLLDPEHELVTTVLDWVRAHLVHEGAVLQVAGSSGLSTRLTSLVGRVELRRGEVSALDRLEWLIPPADVVRTWSDLVHPRLGTGCGGRGWSPVATAAVVDLILDLAAYEHHDGEGLVLLPLVPDAWLGQGIEVHDLRTRLGVLSYAIRWHGARPALLWELVPHDPSTPVTLTIPGLDPGWSTTDARGETLLAAPDRPAAVAPDEGQSFA